MCKKKSDNKSLLDESEKKKLLKSAEIVHQVFNEISEKKKKSTLKIIFEILKHPLIILLVGYFISQILIYKYQKRYEYSTEKVKAKYELSKEVIENIFSKTGEILSHAKEIVILHEEAISDSKQIITANLDYNKAYRDFISSFFDIRFKLRVLFQNKKIDLWWNGIKKSVEELDKCLVLLLECPTDEISETHSERIHKCENKIESINNELSTIYEFAFEAYE